MEDTCLKKECKLWRKYTDSCPNYVVATWKNSTGAETATTHDCAPKRTFFMISELYSRLIGVQESNEEQRNESNQVMGAFTQIVGRMEQQLLIPIDPDFLEGEIIDPKELPEPIKL